MNTPSDDAQRELEQRALRNVRGLVDKIERDDKLQGRSQRRLLASILLGAIALAVVAALFLKREDGGKAVVIEPPAKGAPTLANPPAK